MGAPHLWLGLYVICQIGLSSSNEALLSQTTKSRYKILLRVVLRILKQCAVKNQLKKNGSIVFVLREAGIKYYVNFFSSVMDLSKGRGLADLCLQNLNKVTPMEQKRVHLVVIKHLNELQPDHPQQTYQMHRKNINKRNKKQFKRGSSNLDIFLNVLISKYNV